MGVRRTAKVICVVLLGLSILPAVLLAGDGAGELEKKIKELDESVRELRIENAKLKIRVAKLEAQVKRLKQDELRVSRTQAGAGQTNTENVQEETPQEDEENAADGQMVALPVGIKNWKPYVSGGYAWQEKRELTKKVVKRASSAGLVLVNGTGADSFVWGHDTEIRGDFRAEITLKVLNGEVMFALGNIRGGVHVVNGMEVPLPKGKTCTVVLGRADGDMKCFINGKEEELRPMLHGGKEDAAGWISFHVRGEQAGFILKSMKVQVPKDNAKLQ